MPPVITLKGIDEATSNLNYRNQNALKTRLLAVLRDFYGDESQVESLEAIDPDGLIKSLWDTGNDPAVIKSRRRNLSSLRSSVNNDLEKLFRDGKGINRLQVPAAFIAKDLIDFCTCKSIVDNHIDVVRLDEHIRFVAVGRL